MGQVQTGTQTPSFPVIHSLLKKQALDAKELGVAIDCKPFEVVKVIRQAKREGAMIRELVGGKFTMLPSSAIEPGKFSVRPGKDGWYKFGVLGDTHLCNKHSRLDVLNHAYDRYEQEGITKVFHTGNWVEGEKPFNKMELIVAPGFNHQVDYMIQEYPHKPTIKTYFVSGDDHEGWYQQSLGIEVGKYLVSEAKDQGRDDLIYLGYGECDVELRRGDGSSVMRVLHPGGGSAYALSYTVQKIVESYQGGEKPRVLLAGHYHKSEFCYPREVYTVQTGCTCDQTMFLRKNKIQVHVGYWVIEIHQNVDGVVDSFRQEWVPFFDRGYYEKRF